MWAMTMEEEEENTADMVIMSMEIQKNKDLVKKSMEIMEENTGMIMGMVVAGTVITE